MDAKKEKKRWPLTLVIIAIVVIASAAIIYSYRDAPGSLPVSAVSDGADGIIAAWQNDGGIYAQRVDLSGQVQWQRGGVLICECPPGSGFDLQTDGQGGAIITWNDRSDISDDHDDPTYFDPVPFHSQRVNTSGELLWSDTLVSAGRKWQVVPDGTGGAVFAWDGYQTYSKGLHDDYLYLQRIAPDGTRFWGDDGLLVVASSPFREVTPEETASGVKGIATRTRPTYEGIHYIVADGAGGVIALWEEDTGGEDNRVYAQRLDSNGNYVWPDKVTTAATSLLSAESDGEGGVKIGTPFYADRNTGTVRVYAHISGDGEVLPTSEWVYRDGSVQTVLGGNFRVLVEEDPPDDPPMERRRIIYLQKLDRDGKAAWPEVRVINPPEKTKPLNIGYFNDGDGGAIIVWQLHKNSLPYGDIMAQRLDASGTLRWGEEGTPVFDIPGIRYQSGVTTLSDVSGGTFVIAVLGENGLSGDMIYAQRLDINGNRLLGGGIRIDR
jgi:hypothetical protein